MRLLRLLMCVVPLVAVAALGCSSPTSSSSLDITVEAAAVVHPSEAVTVTLRNLGESPIEYAWCPTRLERKEGSSWHAVPPQTTICQLPLYVLGAGKASTQPFYVPSTLPPGTYRLVLKRSEFVSYRSNSFEVAAS